jgi:hypothetical protein
MALVPGLLKTILFNSVYLKLKLILCIFKLLYVEFNLTLHLKFPLAPMVVLAHRLRTLDVRSSPHRHER